MILDPLILTGNHIWADLFLTFVDAHVIEWEEDDNKEEDKGEGRE